MASVALQKEHIFETSASVIYNERKFMAGVPFVSIHTDRI